MGKLFQIMETIAAVAGLVGFLGAVLLLVGGVWYFAVVRVVKAFNETWWIVAWVLHCRGNHDAAKRSLRAAIDADNKNAP